MLSFTRARRASPAMVVAALALFVALGGTATAAKLLITSAQIKDGTIQVVDWEGNAVMTFKFVRAWPCRYSSPGLNAGANEILVEELELAHEGFERE